MIYLASPYSDDSPVVMEARYEAVLKHTAGLIKDGLTVFSPIVHCHYMAISYDLPSDISFWRMYDTNMIFLADMFWVLMLDGWQQSKGVSFEIEVARSFKLSIKFVKE